MAQRTPVPALTILSVLLLAAPARATTAGEIEALIKAGKLDDAVAAAKGAVDAVPADPDLRGAYAHALAAKGRKLKRVVDLSVSTDALTGGAIPLPRVGAETPGRPEVVYDPALLEQALGQIREAVRLAPGRKEFRLTECYLLTDAGDVERAAAAIRSTAKARAGDPSLARELAAFGVERGNRGDSQGAAILLRAAAESFPLDSSLATDLGMALVRAGKKTEALAALDRAVSLSPGDPQAARKLATGAALLRDFRKARAGFESAFQSEQQDIDRLGAAAMAVPADPALARSELEALAVPSSSADPALTDAAKDLLSAISDPKWITRNSLAVAKRLVEKDRGILALPLVDRIVRASPGNREAAALMVRVLKTHGCEAAARQVLEDARVARKPAQAPQPKR